VGTRLRKAGAMTCPTCAKPLATDATLGCCSCDGGCATCLAFCWSEFNREECRERGLGKLAIAHEVLEIALRIARGGYGAKQRLLRGDRHLFDELSAAAARLRDGLLFLVGVPPHDLWILVLGYVRYSMGRRSSAPSLAAGYVRVYWSAFSAGAREQIRREVTEEVERFERSKLTLGDDCDHQVWRELIAWMEGQ